MKLSAFQNTIARRMFEPERQLVGDYSCCWPEQFSPGRPARPALTAVDLATYAPCSPGQGLLILADLAASISRRDLRKALEANRTVPAAQRLGFLLDRAGQAKLTPVVREWLADRKLAAVPLDPGGGQAETDPEWGIQMNANLEAAA